MKVLFTTNFPSSYRVNFFNELGKLCDLTVLFERSKAKHRDEKWGGGEAEHFHAVQLNMCPFRRSQSIGSAIVREIKHEQYDFIVFSGYSSPSVMLAVFYCQCRKIPYYFEYDGGFNDPDSGIVAILKKWMLRPAGGHFITSHGLEEFLVGIGVTSDKIFYYPFSSIYKNRMIDTPPTEEDKRQLKETLGIAENKAVLAVGQFIHRKGFDVLLNAAIKMDRAIGIYFIGGRPGEEYLALKSKNDLTNVHFIDFIPHDKLQRWYQACDIFVLPTRYDIWGLVINEAMANALPVISTTRCVAATELITDGQNGFVINPDDADSLATRISELLSNDALLKTMSFNALEAIRNYTLEQMARVHYQVFTDREE